jgi:SPX domain protein involved in polyphosphate accumulation
VRYQLLLLFFFNSLQPFTQAEAQLQREKEEEERRRKEEEADAAEDIAATVVEEKVNPYFTTSYDLFACDIPMGSPFPLFPYGEVPPVWDEYGEVLDIFSHQ